MENNTTPHTPLKKLQSERTIVLATHNQGKHREFTAMLAPLLEPWGWQLRSMRDYNIPSPPEDGTTFKDNATHKALHAFSHTNLPTIADDSGLCVDQLNQQPGVYSARWAINDKGESDFTLAMNKVLQDMSSYGDPQQRKAHFTCALTLVIPADTMLHRATELSVQDTELGVITTAVEGYLHGIIAMNARGEAGFGYDPIFIAQSTAQSLPDLAGSTLAQMPAAHKHAISHRAQAVNLIMPAIKSLLHQ